METVTRGQFLLAGLAASTALYGQASSVEDANLAVVRDFCAAFATKDMAKIASYLAPEIVYRITETAPAVKGMDAIARIRTYVERANTIEFKIHDSWARGPMVINERTDTFVTPERTNAYHLVGVFFLQGGKIAEWSDYGIR